MSATENFRGRAKPKRYVPPRPSFTVEQRLDECLRIAEAIECGTSTPVDEIALHAHLRVLRGLEIAEHEEDNIARSHAAASVPVIEDHGPAFPGWRLS